MKGNTTEISGKWMLMNDVTLIFPLPWECTERDAHIWDLSDCQPLLLLFTILTSTGSTKNLAPTRQADVRPNFTMSVDTRSRALHVSVAAGPQMRLRLCYRREVICSEMQPSLTKVISDSQTVSLNFTFLLPCLCLQVYHIKPDAVRNTSCPFENYALEETDVWSSGEWTLLPNSLRWRTPCPMKPSAALCWRRPGHIPGCLRIANSTLRGDSKNTQTNYNISFVDQHPNICVQLTLNGSSYQLCPFKPGRTRWDAEVLPGWPHMHVWVTSAIQASFSAQLCLLQQRVCAAWGAIHTGSAEGGGPKAHLLLPYTHLKKNLCVQVWQSDPALTGWRLFCPDYTHRRWGLVAMATVVLFAASLMLVWVSYCATKKRLSGWRQQHRPVLLLCSSQQASQVSAVCSLASLLQAELLARVRMALLGHTQGSGSVADLGLLPWFYGQCEEVRAQGGCVLIAWSREANQAYLHWRGEEQHEGKAHMKKMLDGRGKEDAWDEEEEAQEIEPSALTGPLIQAALFYLQGELQEQGWGKGQGLALLCFQEFCHTQDIPQELRGLPVFLLPRDFRALLLELQTTGGRRCHCLSQILSVLQQHRTARRLARGIQPWLPSAGGACPVAQ